jgi:cytoskeletal protein RodZ
MPILLPERGDATGFGDFLRDARERRGLTLQQISAETKIPWRHLDALEHGNFAAVPSGMYRRAEIRAYASAVGIDQGLALAELEHALATASKPSEAEAREVPLSRKLLDHPMALSAVAVVLVMVVAGLFWSRVSTGSSDGATVTATPAAPAPAAAAPSSSGGAAAPVVDAVDVSAPTAASTPPAAIAPAEPTQDVLAADTLPAATAGELIVITRPQGARVIVDDIGRGSAPATIRHLAAGTKRIRVIKDGYVSEERVISFSPRRGQTIAIALQSAR